MSFERWMKLLREILEEPEEGKKMEKVKKVKDGQTTYKELHQKKERDNEL